jgi:hypothetical protein
MNLLRPLKPPPRRVFKQQANIVTTQVKSVWALSPHIEARLEVWQLTDSSGKPYDKPVDVTGCYSTPTGAYVGDLSMGKFLVSKHIQPELASPKHSVCSIGFSAFYNQWFGWSHRALSGFGIGDKLFESDFGDDTTVFTQHGSKTIATMEEAKLAAIAFADYVS